MLFTGASRTDAGVHALGQVARIELDVPITAEHLKNVLNHALPSSVHVRSVQQVPKDFHPRVSVQEKTYYYHFFTSPPSPFVSRFGTYVKDLDLDRFKQALAVFKGTHDFRAFCTGEQGRTTVRTINSVDVHYYKRYGIYQVRIKGPSFLTHMIRRMVGACFDVATSKSSIERITDALASKNPDHNLFVAPPEGLLLHGIKYSPKEDQAART